MNRDIDSQIEQLLKKRAEMSERKKGEDVWHQVWKIMFGNQKEIPDLANHEYYYIGERHSRQVLKFIQTSQFGGN